MNVCLQRNGLFVLMLLLVGISSATPISARDGLETPEDVVNAFAQALRAGNEEAIRSLLSPNVIIAESGGAERSLDEYASHHMSFDMEFMGAIDNALVKRDVLSFGDAAIVISESVLHGNYKDSVVHARSMETMVLDRIDGHWRIRHIHWSTAPMMGEDEH